MTEGQRDYLADLALKKGVVLNGTGNVSAAWASKKIEELKAMPDADFTTPSPKTDATVQQRITKIKAEVSKWTFQA